MLLIGLLSSKIIYKTYFLKKLIKIKKGQETHCVTILLL